MKTIRTAGRAFATMLVAAIASCALAGTAFAATVHGADDHGTGSALESGSVNVLNVDGNAGETIFIHVKYNDKDIAKNLPYTIGAKAEQGDKASWAGVATLNIDNLDLSALDGSYTIEASSDRVNSKVLYSGALYGVYADLPDGEAVLVGTRTADADEVNTRNFDPAETLYISGKTYRLAGDAENLGGVLHFPYEEYSEASTVDGVVKYTDAAGNVVATDKIPGLAYGEERTIEIPSVITNEKGDVYRTVFFKNSVTAVNPGQTSFSVYCTQMSEADKALAGYYLATIKMVDGAGNVIATDTVDVTGEFIYTAPTSIYKNETIDGEATVVTYEIDGSPVIHLSAAKDNVQNRERTITVPYTAQPLEAAQVTVTFNLLDGNKRVGDKDRVLGTQQIVATEDNPVVQPVSQIEVGDTTYRLAGDPADYEYKIRTGMVPSIDAFYVPEDYVAPGAYDVTVNYVNFLTGATVESHTYTSDPDANARIEIETPAEFSSGDVNYVRLAGQENAIRHSYYSGNATYTVYYRDVNDTLSSGTVINTIRVVYVDSPATAGTTTDQGTIIIVNNEIVEEGGAEGAAGAAGAAGTAGTTGGEGAAGTEGAEGPTALQLNSGRTYNVFDGGDNNATLTNEAGVDSNTERIEDTETPLAAGLDKGATSSAASGLMASYAWVIPAVIGAVVLAVIVFAVVSIRRRKNSDMYEL